MYMKLKDGKSKVLTFSYDDGVIQDIRLIEILNKHGLKGTFNINTGRYLPEDTERDKPYDEIARDLTLRRMRLSEAQKLYVNSGHEVAVHGYDHLFLTQSSNNEIFYEILEDRKNIQKQYKTMARGMAYSMGRFDDRVNEVLRQCGICYSRSTKSTESLEFPKEWLPLHPTCSTHNPRLMELAERFVEKEPRHRCDNWMFYVWGHAYEFDEHNSWDIIEKFAEYIGGRDDTIWYATNIEIYDYVQAYNSLQISADKSFVHNPTATDVWFIENNKTYCVRGGETLFL